MVLRFQMAPEQQPRPSSTGTPDNVTDSIELRFQSSFTHSLNQPMARLHILRRVGRPMHAGLVPAYSSQIPKIFEKPIAVDAGHIISQSGKEGRLNGLGVSSQLGRRQSGRR
jgi:hypothetical protein